MAATVEGTIGSQQVYCGLVKQILSGDSVVIRDRPRGKAPEEWTCSLTGITAPRLARRPPPQGFAAGNASGEHDEPYAFEAREFLRKKTIGKAVCFVVETRATTANQTQRLYGTLYLGTSAASGENINELLVSEGLVEIRRPGGGNAAQSNLSEAMQRLLILEEEARTAGKGRHNASEASNLHVRNIRWTLDNPRQFVESHKRQALPAIVEHVRDGSSFRVLLLLENRDFVSVQLILTGVKAPAFKENAPEPFAEEARFFTEVRLLQRNCHVLLEGENNAALVGTIQHPNGNIAELLLCDGLGRCVDWTMGLVPRETAERMRKSEREAKDKRLRLWKDYTPSASIAGRSATNGGAATNFSAKVLEVGNGDNLTVVMSDGKLEKYFLSSIRPPRMQQPQPQENAGPKAGGGGGAMERRRPLYDVPYLFEAREFLRKKLVGKKVNVRLDYVQPKSAEGYEEKRCATITVGEQNVAEALVAKGLAELIRYRADDENRSQDYDALLAAYAVAQKKQAGLHSKKDVPTHRVADLAGEPAKARQFLAFLKRAGRCEAVVEFVASGNRLRLYIPRETCLVTVLCAGIETPRAPRRNPGAGSTDDQGEPYGLEAANFTRKLMMQREVEVAVDSCDKGGNFIGWMHHDGTNLSVALVEAGLAKVHFSAERSDYFEQLTTAESKAKAARLGVWTNWTEPVVSVSVEPQRAAPAADDESADAELDDSEDEGDSFEDSLDGPEVAERRKKAAAERKKAAAEAKLKAAAMKAGSAALVSEVRPDAEFYVQYQDKADDIQSLCGELQEAMLDAPPVSGAYTPKKGDLCAAQFTEDLQWYRAKVLRTPNKELSTTLVLFIDFGNEEEARFGALAALPSQLASRPAYAHAMRLACVQLPPDDEDQAVTLADFSRSVCNQLVRVAVEYTVEGQTHCVVRRTNGEDVAQELIQKGLLTVTRMKRPEYRLVPLLKRYLAVQETAKQRRYNCWRYGDFEED